MGAIIKTQDEILKMRVAGKLAAEVLNMIGEYVVKGTTTDAISQPAALPCFWIYHGSRRASALFYHTLFFGPQGLFATG